MPNAADWLLDPPLHLPWTIPSALGMPSLPSVKSTLSVPCRSLVFQSPTTIFTEHKILFKGYLAEPRGRWDKESGNSPPTYHGSQTPTSLPKFEAHKRAYTRVSDIKRTIGALGLTGGYRNVDLYSLRTVVDISKATEIEAGEAYAWVDRTSRAQIAPSPGRRRVVDSPSTLPSNSTPKSKGVKYGEDCAWMARTSRAQRCFSLPQVQAVANSPTTIPSNSTSKSQESEGGTAYMRVYPPPRKRANSVPYASPPPHRASARFANPTSFSSTRLIGRIDDGGCVCPGRQSGGQLVRIAGFESLRLTADASSTDSSRQPPSPSTGARDLTRSQVAVVQWVLAASSFLRATASLSSRDAIRPPPNPPTRTPNLTSYQRVEHRRDPPAASQADGVVDAGSVLRNLLEPMGPHRVKNVESSRDAMRQPPYHPRKRGSRRDWNGGDLGGAIALSTLVEWVSWSRQRLPPPDYKVATPPAREYEAAKSRGREESVQSAGAPLWAAGCRLSTAVPRLQALADQDSRHGELEESVGRYRAGLPPPPLLSLLCSPSTPHLRRRYPIANAQPAHQNQQRRRQRVWLRDSKEQRGCSLLGRPRTMPLPLYFHFHLHSRSTSLTLADLDSHHGELKESGWACAEACGLAGMPRSMRAFELQWLGQHQHLSSSSILSTLHSDLHHLAPFENSTPHYEGADGCSQVGVRTAPTTRPQNDIGEDRSVVEGAWTSWGLQDVQGRLGPTRTSTGEGRFWVTWAGAAAFWEVLAACGVGALAMPFQEAKTTPPRRLFLLQVDLPPQRSKTERQTGGDSTSSGYGWSCLSQAGNEVWCWDVSGRPLGSKSARDNWDCSGRLWEAGKTSQMPHFCPQGEIFDLRVKGRQGVAAGRSAVVAAAAGRVWFSVAKAKWCWVDGVEPQMKSPREEKQRFNDVGGVSLAPERFPAKLQHERIECDQGLRIGLRHPYLIKAVWQTNRGLLGEARQFAYTWVISGEGLRRHKVFNVDARKATVSKADLTVLISAWRKS
ncbi:hypothetical protein CVT26_015251 [Gymnopilus dilepis]|uniref:Uncharacterized protein n=1 Tax=Gymnopilus dilepis TaxID=231916 RepID=A0A409WLT4_9AGAR|nr:hypothetical protein CVT26_015251 [Gymnopilus dilepis]